jgi:hypothetical protein
MPEEVVRQRIKFLVEHGELYPQQEQRAHDKRISWAVLALLALNTIEVTTLAAKYLL